MSKCSMIIFLACCCFSCDPNQNKITSKANEDIKGSWFMSKNENQIYETYREVLITDTLIRSYDEDFGLRLPIKYALRDDTLFFIFDDVKYNNGIINKIDDDLFSIKTQSNVLYMKKIKSGCKKFVGEIRGCRSEWAFNGKQNSIIRSNGNIYNSYWNNHNVNPKNMDSHAVFYSRYLLNASPNNSLKTYYTKSFSNRDLDGFRLLNSVLNNSNL